MEDNQTNQVIFDSSWPISQSLGQGELLKLLFATDFSPSSKVAMHMISNLQKHYKTQITLTHILASFWKNWISSGLYEKEATQRLETWQKELTGEINTNLIHVTTGNPADSIVSAAIASQADLIVMGSKNPSNKDRYRSGSTVGTVARNARQSVLICNGKKITKILCGIDGSASSANALIKAIGIANQFNAELEVIYALCKINLSLTSLDEKEASEQQEQRFKEKNERFFSDFLSKFDFGQLKIRQQISWGKPANVILNAAEDFEFDLIVIGAKGHSILEHVLVGSTADKIIRFAPCSLLIVR